MVKRTLVLGASLNHERYSYRALKSLQTRKIPFVAIGRREDAADGIHILTGSPEIKEQIHTVTMYMNPHNQKPYYDYLLNLKPERIIFNPGTINPEFAELATARGIETVDACTLVLLCTGTY
jgi:uncharacterized protein